jgi:hypothetical protein
MLSPRAQLQIKAIGELLQKVQHVHGLVEKYAVEKTTQSALEQPMKRTFDRLKLEFMAVGQDALSQLAGGLVMAVGRGGSKTQKVRTLREGVGSMKFQLELEQRTIAAADKEAQEKDKETTE